MSILSNAMRKQGQLVANDAASLTGESIKLREALLDLHLKIEAVDSYTHSGLEEKWKRIRDEYDTLLHSLNETAKLCADRIGGYITLLPDIDQPDLFEDARIELRAAIDALEESKKANPDQPISEKFKLLGDKIAKFVNETGAIITKKSDGTDIALANAKKQLSDSQLKVARLQEKISALQTKSLFNKIKNTVQSGPSDQSTEDSAVSERLLKAELTDAEGQLTLARDANSKVEAEARARENANWPLASTSLNNAKTLLRTVASKHVVINDARNILTDELKGYLKAFDECASANTQQNQLALANYHRKARDDQPILVLVQNSLEKFAYEFK